MQYVWGFFAGVSDAHPYGCTVMAERLRERGTGATEEAGGVVQRIRPDERGAYAEGRRHEGVQGVCVCHMRLRT